MLINYDQKRSHKIASIKKIAKPLAFHSGLPGLMRSVRRAGNQKYIFILMYHRITPNHLPYLDLAVAPEIFERQIRYLKKHYHILSFNDLKKPSYFESLKKDGVIITFDDGYRDNFTYGFPIFRKYNIPALIFLITGFVGTDRIIWYDRLNVILTIGAGSYDEKKVMRAGIPDDAKAIIKAYYAAQKGFKKVILAGLIEKWRWLENDVREAYLSETAKSLNAVAFQGERLMLNWDEVAYMSKRGIDFAPHTVNHPVLSDLTFEEAEKEILDSKKAVENVTGKSAFVFAYPYGKKRHYSEETVAILKRNGFMFAVTADQGKESLPFKNPYEIVRRGPEDTPYLFY